MIDTKSVNVSKLPSLPIEWRKAFPVCPGIYFVIDSGEEVLYVGRAKNIQARWGGHHKLKELALLSGVRLAWLEITDLKLLDGIEKALIEWFKPPLNGRSSFREGRFLRQGKLYERLRERAGLTQREIGEVLGVTDQTVSNWERGVKTMKLTIEQTSSLCKLFNCTFEELEKELRG
jgi:DNA-binding XRE family transcriptional regulator